jgi:hypothetical protein
MQGESASTSVYHSSNASVEKVEDEMAEATIGDLANLTTATSAYRIIVASLMEVNSCLVNQLEDRSSDFK